MKVIFIIPAYNAAPHVEDLVKSLKEQTNTNWGAIFIDDMSDDDTIFMINHYTGNDKRFELINGLRSLKIIPFFGKSGMFATYFLNSTITPYELMSVRFRKANN